MKYASKYTISNIQANIQVQITKFSYILTMGFCKGFDSQPCLIIMIEKGSDLCCKADFSKSFDGLPHELFMHMLWNH